MWPDTPAQKAGIKSGDVIAEFNGKDVSDANGLRLTVSNVSRAPGHGESYSATARKKPSTSPCGIAG